mmetsp:Transcript_29326/g.76027  ORF Transcript_29326/g.76027 Transcript_29326/m.76027 type:complete len:238 (+) Transcript_29326:1405-2118(+)
MSSACSCCTACSSSLLRPWSARSSGPGSMPLVSACEALASASAAAAVAAAAAALASCATASAACACCADEVAAAFAAIRSRLSSAACCWYKLSSPCRPSSMVPLCCFCCSNCCSSSAVRDFSTCCCSSAADSARCRSESAPGGREELEVGRPSPDAAASFMDRMSWARRVLTSASRVPTFCSSFWLRRSLSRSMALRAEPSCCPGALSWGLWALAIACSSVSFSSCTIFLCACARPS